MGCSICGSSFHEATTAGCPDAVSCVPPIRPTSEKQMIDILNEILSELRTIRTVLDYPIRTQ